MIGSQESAMLQIDLTTVGPFFLYNAEIMFREGGLWLMVLDYSERHFYMLFLCVIIYSFSSA